MAGGGPVETLPDGSILFSQGAPYRIVHYPAASDDGRQFASDRDILGPIGDDFIQETGAGMNLRRTFKWFSRSPAGYSASKAGES